MSSIRFAVAGILSAFSSVVVGSKVVDSAAFLAALEVAVAGHDISRDRVPGQHFIVMPPEAYCTVSAGVGLKEGWREEDYIVRMHRGQPTLCLKREFAAAVESLACVVYTRQAYLADPDVQKDPAEIARVEALEATHTVVAVLASAGPKAPLTPYRLVHNLAGGNKEAALWSTEEIHVKAEESLKYWDKWAVVAD